MQGWTCQEMLLRDTGVVVPAYFSANPSDDLVRQLLRVTLGDDHLYLPAENVWVVVDGDARTARLAEELRADLEARHGAAFHLHSLPRNGGKLWALREGVRGLLAARPNLRYVAIRDGDGDHAISDLPNLLRAADELALAHGSGRVILAGARHSRHHPMGWVRGELETLLDGATLDALAYHLARKGSALDLTHCLPGGALPDISSGYKVYGREMAEVLFVEQEARPTCLEEAAYWRYGPETVTAVEGILAGGAFGEARRATFDGQPTSSFGDLSAVALYGDLLAWLFCRLDVPTPVAAQFYDNRAAGLALRTTAPGAEMLEAVRHRALAQLIAYLGEAYGPPPARRRPTFM